jgi:hypothetical protein
MFIGDGSHVFRENKKTPNVNADSEASMTYYTPQHCMIQFAAAHFRRNFPLLRGVEIFIRRFQMPSRLFSLCRILF